MTCKGSEDLETEGWANGPQKNYLSMTELGAQGQKVSRSSLFVWTNCSSESNRTGQALNLNSPFGKAKKLVDLGTILELKIGECYSVCVCCVSHPL